MTTKDKKDPYKEVAESLQLDEGRRQSNLACDSERGGGGVEGTEGGRGDDAGPIRQCR